MTPATRHNKQGQEKRQLHQELGLLLPNPAKVTFVTMAIICNYLVKRANLKNSAIAPIRENVFLVCIGK